MAKKGRAGSSYKTQYSAYKSNSTYAKNRKEDLERHVRKFPEDLQAKERLESKAPFTYRRKKSMGSANPLPKENPNRKEMIKRQLNSKPSPKPTYLVFLENFSKKLHTESLNA
jgi:hypothetical protein